MRINKKPRKLILVILTFVFLSSCKGDSPAKVAGDLITSFGGSCSSNGRWSQAAIAQSQALVNVLEKLKETDSCKNLANMIGEMHSTAQKIHDVYQDSSYMEYRQKEEELQELLLVLSGTTDESLRVLLSNEILQKQVELANARATNSAQSVANSSVGFQDKYSQTTQALGGQFANLFSHAGEMSACLQQSPSAAVTIFSELSGIAGSFVSPVLGSYAQVLSGMMSTLMNFVRQNKIEEAIWDLHKSNLRQAVTCGLESMTQFYCQAEDAAEIVFRQAESYEQREETPTNFWRGIDLITRRLTVLNDWLLSVRSGVEPSNPNDAERISKVREKRLKLDTTDLSVIGSLNDAKRKVSSATDENTKQDIKIDTVIELSKALSGNNESFGTNSAPNPFKEFQNSAYTYSCLLLKGVDFVCPNGELGETLRNYIARLPGGTQTISLDDISLNWKNILTRVTNKVMVEFNDVISIDPELTISKAFEESANNISPLESLKMTQDFLQDFYHNSESKHPSRLKGIRETINLIEAARSIIQNYIGNEGKSEINPLVEIYVLFRLDFGTQFFNQRITEYVRYDLLDRLKSGELPEEIEDIIQSANEEIIHRLTASGFKDLFPIIRDLDMARSQSVDTYKIFRNYILETASKVLEIENKKSIQAGESIEQGPRRKYGQNVAHLCLLLFATSQESPGSSKVWPNEGTQKICENAVLFSVYPDKKGERKLAIKDLPSKLNLPGMDSMQKNRKRICVYNNFLRAERLYEIVRGKNKSKDTTHKNSEVFDSDLFNKLIW